MRPEHHLFLKLLLRDDVVDVDATVELELVLSSSCDPCGLDRMGSGDGVGVGSGEGSSLMGERHLP